MHFSSHSLTTMRPTLQTADDDDENTARQNDVGRRRFLALGASAGALMLAGCSGDGNTGGGNGGSGTKSPSARSQETGTFRLLISDRPNAIGDFDSLTVTFDRARVFRGEDEEADDETAGGTPTETSSATPTATETATPTATATSAAADEAEETENDEESEDAEVTVIDLDGKAVDLTTVVGDKATGIFEDGLPAGRYTKVELYVAEVDGVVDGEQADVKLPSGKLQLTKPFTVEADSSMSFVFDISVVKKGNGGYNLLPVVSESGVDGEDVDVEEVEEEDGDEEEDDDKEEDGDEADDGTPTADPDGTTVNGTEKSGDGNETVDGGTPTNATQS